MNCEALEYTPSDTEDYMNDRQLQYFRKRLLLQQEELRTLILESRIQVQSIRDKASDPVDLSCAETNMTMLLNELNRCHRVLCQVQLALERIDDGTFGYCSVTGNEIGIKRLNALPFATLTVETQEMLESFQNSTLSSLPADIRGFQGREPVSGAL